MVVNMHLDIFLLMGFMSWLPNEAECNHYWIQPEDNFIFFYVNWYYNIQ